LSLAVRPGENPAALDPGPGRSTAHREAVLGGEPGHGIDVEVKAEPARQRSQRSQRSRISRGTTSQISPSPAKYPSKPPGAMISRTRAGASPPGDLADDGLVEAADLPWQP
jgi:hypothetical protein